MSTVRGPDRAPEALAELVRRCRALCGSAEEALGDLPAERESFLSTNLGDVLSHLELVLRAVGQDSDVRTRREERHSFLRRLFRRPAPGPHPYRAPDFDVSRQGLQGNSSTVSMGELLGFLAFGRKTGVLWIDTPHEDFLIGLVDGQVRHAASDRAPAGLRLGEVLVSLGYLDADQLERLVEQVDGPGLGGKISGEHLVSSGLVHPEDLRHALEVQVQHLVQRVLAAPAALFRFREGMEILVAHGVALGVNHLLLESARAQDEAARSQSRSETDEWHDWQGALGAEVLEATRDEPPRAP
jgi:hypothetical protein